MQNAEAANRAVERAKALKGALNNAPGALKQQARERAKAAAKQTFDQANSLKNAVTNAPKALQEQETNAKEAVKAKVQEETAKGMMDLLR